MIFTSPPTRFQLNATQVLNVREAQGTRVVCNQGIVWLTQEGDSHDIFLRQGDEWVIELDGLVLIQALEDAVIQIMPRTVQVKPEAVSFSISPLKRLRTFCNWLGHTVLNGLAHARYRKQL